MKSTSIKTVGFLLLLALSTPSWATSGGEATSGNHATTALQLQHRLEEIRALDTSTLSRAEKKALRREVREIKKELAAISGGVYLSVGAILLIALLLILLL